MDTIDSTETVEKKGISRRAVIVGGATGAAAFWSVPVIDSVISRAAAGSGCVGCTSANMIPSYASVVFQQGGNTYVVKFVQGSSVCTGDDSLSGDLADGTVFTSNCNGNSFSKVSGSLYMNGNPITAFPGPGCPVTSSGSGVCIPSGGTASILFVLGHDGSYTNHWKAFCPAISPACSVTGF